MENLYFIYNFKFANGTKKIIEVRIDPDTLDILEELPNPLPPWTKLEFMQCPHCPLDKKKQDYCPSAGHLVNLIVMFSDIISCEDVALKVNSPDRTISKITTAQNALSSLMGLIMPASGCYYTSFLKPMLRFHLPFSTEEETIYRSSSMYLLAQYFLKKEGGRADLDLEGLKKIYKNIQIVNINMAKRLRTAAEKDSAINALVILDIFAKILPLTIEESLNDVRYLFAPYLEEKRNVNGGVTPF